MAELKNSVIYNLTTAFKYAYKGDQQKAEFITLNAPSSLNLKECAYLKQCFYRAIPKADATVSKETDKNGEIDSDAIMALLSMSSDVDLDKVLLVASKLFISPKIGLIDGETQLKQTHIDGISFDDLEGMVGKYLENFILASSLKKLKNS